LYAVEDTPLDTAGAIRFAATQAGFEDAFVVVNGDVLTGLDVAGLVVFHRSRGAEATIALTPVEDPSAFGVVPTDPDGRVLAFVEKPPPGEAPTNLVNAGTYVLERSVLDRIPGDRRVSIERETFPTLVDEGRVYALASDTDWVDAGTPSTYLAANLRYSSAPASSCSIAPGAVVTGSYLGSSVEVGAGAVVDSSLLMDGARIEEAAQVRHSIVGTCGVIGAGARVCGLSVIGDSYAVDPGMALDGARLPAPQ
jgi:NDP-sugar pyrophosphorylase family protein